MSFTGNPGTGKTTVAMRMAEVLHRLGYVRKGHVIAVTRDDLVGQYIGHTAPKTKEVLKKAMGGVLFIDEAYYLHRPENEKDYGQEAIEILLQVMENQRDDLVVILAGYADRMEEFFDSNPGFSSRVAHHVDFPDYTDDELLEIADRMLAEWSYRFDPGARQAFAEYLEIRRTRPHFANARSVRNALDRIRMRQALRLFESATAPSRRDDLSVIWADEVRAAGCSTTTRPTGRAPDDVLARRCRDARANATTLTQYLIEYRRHRPEATGDFNELVLGVALACKADRAPGRARQPRAAHSAARGHQRPGRGAEELDVIANEFFVRTTEWTGVLAGMASEEMELPLPVPSEYPRGKYLLVFDPSTVRATST